MSVEKEKDLSAATNKSQVIDILPSIVSYHFLFKYSRKEGKILVKILNKIARSIVYHCTEKPTHYVHVDNPKTFQEYRQVQYNNWCKAKGVYNGSYLPKNPNTLNHKGWINITSSKNKSGKKHYMRKSSGQIVRFDPENDTQIDHYHWSNPMPTKVGHKITTEYLDRYGRPCTKNDDQHHLAPLDRDCPPKARKR